MYKIVVGLTKLHLASERKIDSIEHRLDHITRLLQDLKTHAPATKNNNDVDREGSGPSAAATVSSVAIQSPSSVPAGTTVAEGESSLSAHSVFVNNFMQALVEAEQPDPETQSNVEALSHIACTSNKRPEARESVLPNAQLPKPVHQRKFDLPPLQDAAALIRLAQGEHAIVQKYRLRLLRLTSIATSSTSRWNGMDIRICHDAVFH